MLRIVLKNSNQITFEEWQAIAIGFNQEFDRNKSPEQLLQFYRASTLGYSFHALAFAEDGELAGFTTIIPYIYKDNNGKSILTGLSGSTFVKKAYRKNIFVLRDLYESLRQVCVDAGMIAILGVPNQNAFRYLLKLLNFNFLFDLNYLVLPLTLAAFTKRKLPRLVGRLYRFLILAYVRVVVFVTNAYDPVEKTARYTVHFSEEVFRKRFSDEHYRSKIVDGVNVTYRIFNENNLVIAYLIDFSKSSRRSLSTLAKSVDCIAREESVDMIAYVGKLSIWPNILIRLPKAWEPKQLPLVIDVLAVCHDKDYVDLKNPCNWDFGLLNLDVR